MMGTKVTFFLFFCLPLNSADVKLNDCLLKCAGAKMKKSIERIDDQTLSALDTVMREAQTVSEVDPETETIPRTAYDEAIFILIPMAAHVPMPEFTWLIDGGLGMEWRHEDKIFTLSLYGDGHVIFTGIFGDENEMSGISPISDTNFDTIIVPAIIRHFSGD